MTKYQSNKIRAFLYRIWPQLVLLIIVILYFTSNLQYRNQTIFLKTRSPVSASCLRNFRNAPTYCGRELFIFDWKVGGYELLNYMAPSLERSHLSVFAPHQRWTLQGDFILDNVYVPNKAGVPKTFWSTEDNPAQPVSFTDYRHLNLILPSTNTLEWTIEIPQNIESAKFHTATAVFSTLKINKLLRPLNLVVMVNKGNDTGVVVLNRVYRFYQKKWRNLDLDLTPFAGKKITLLLTSKGGQETVPLLAAFRFPYIDLSLKKEELAPIDGDKSVAPSNTDLNPSLPRPTKEDLDFDIGSLNNWIVNNMHPGESPQLWHVEIDPNMIYKLPLNLCLADYRYLYVRIAASPDIISPSTDTLLRQVEVSFQIDGSSNYPVVFSIPLLADGEVHEYTYDLKLLELKLGQRLSGIKMSPVVAGAGKDKDWVKILNLSLIRDIGMSVCI